MSEPKNAFKMNKYRHCLFWRNEGMKMICRDNPLPHFSYCDQKNIFTGCSLLIEYLKDGNKCVWLE